MNHDGVSLSVFSICFARRAVAALVKAAGSCVGSCVVHSSRFSVTKFVIVNHNFDFDRE